MRRKEALLRLLNEDNRWDYKKLLELAERDTPMKPISSGNTSSISKHCICDKVVMPYDRFCPKCGQRLDWSERK